MADSSPSSALELLREIIRGAAAGAPFPGRAETWKRFADQPWILDDLQRDGWARTVSGYLVPSLRGLAVAGVPEAREALDKAKQLWETIQRLYREGRIKNADDPDVARELGWPGTLVSRQLAFLALESGFYGAYATGDGSMPISNVQLVDPILSMDPFAGLELAKRPVERGPITLVVRSFRGLRHVEWSPDGVCLIAGPNGSGKTTLLEAFLFLCDAFQTTFQQAIRRQRGTQGFQHIRPDGTGGVSFSLRVGEIDWALRLEVGAGAAVEYPEEAVSIGSKVVLRRSLYSAEWYLEKQRRGPDHQGRACLRVAWESGFSANLEPLVDVITGFRYHAGYAVEQLRQGGKGGEDDAFLSPQGENLFVVLRNWKAAPRKYENRFEWVLSHVRKAFPGIVEDIEFDPPVGEIVPARFYGLDDRVGLPMSRAADGFLVGLLHLTAIAGADNGSIVAIDEMENALHPHAIRSILASMRERADEKSLIVLLTTHSPVLMNEFRDQPQRFFVTDVGQTVLPVALDKLRDPDWLAHFSFGDLYDRLEIGAPHEGK